MSQNAGKGNVTMHKVWSIKQQSARKENDIKVLSMCPTSLRKKDYANIIFLDNVLNLQMQKCVKHCQPRCLIPLPTRSLIESVFQHSTRLYTGPQSLFQCYFYINNLIYSFSFCS